MGATYQPPQWLIPDNANTDKVGSYSFQFDGTADYIDIGTDNSLDILGSDFTISLWAKWGSQSSNSNGFINLGVFTDKAMVGLGFGTAYGKISFGTGTSGSIGVLKDCGSGYDDDNWHHIVCIEDGGVRSVYVDDVDITGTGSASSIAVSSNNDIAVRDRGGTDRFFVGEMSEISIFNYALTSGEVTTLYGDATDGVGNPMGLDVVPIAYYKGDRSAFGGVEWAVPNQLSEGYVFDFDGSTDYITLSSDITFPAEFSLSFWINPDTLSQELLLGDGGSSNNWIELTSATSFKVKLKSTTTTFTESGGNDFTIDTWQHVFITRDSSDNLSVYRNASIFGSSAVNAVTDSTYSTIGNRGTRWFEGKMSNIASWTSDQSANMVAIYNNGRPGDLTSLSPISWWKLDASAIWTTSWSVPDAGSASNTGTSSGMTQGNLIPDIITRGTSLYSNYSFDFDGVGDYFDCGQVTELESASAFTVSGWFNQTTLDQQRFMWGTYISATNMISCYTWSDGNMYFDVRNAATTYGSFDYSTVVTAGTWFHCACVFDGTGVTDADKIKIYINGTEITLSYSGTLPTTTNATQGDFWIGENEGWSGYAYDWLGGMSNMAIWDSALTDANILTIYNNGKPGDLTSLSPTSWWRLGEDAFASVASPTAWTIPDQIGSNDGTSVGNPELVGEAPQSYANGLSDSMDIYDRIGESGFSDLNALSYNMSKDTRKAY